jgi:hypothetical protein
MSKSHTRGLVRHNFSEHEDELLRELVEEFGNDDWSSVAEELQGRSPRQCKERWNHYLSPDLVQGKWSQEEDELLTGLVKKHGTKWKLLEHYFAGRTDTNIKNRYNVLARREAKQRKKALKLSPNKPEEPDQAEQELQECCQLFTAQECEVFWNSIVDW